jgi:cytochrome c biogenesis factor
VVKSSVADGLTVVYPTDPDGRDVNAVQQHYHVELHTQTLHQGGKTYTYFDQSQAVRQ